MSKSVVVVGACVVGLLLLFPLLPSLLGTNQESSAIATPASTPPSQPVPVPKPVTPPPAPQPTAPQPGVPSVVSMNPPNGAAGVSPYTTQLVVMFSEPMGGGFSWTGGGPEFPETTGKPFWAADRRTCVLPVRLQPNWSYRVGLNSPSHKNFRSASGTPLQQVVWRFSTGNQ